MHKTPAGGTDGGRGSGAGLRLEIAVANQTTPIKTIDKLCLRSVDFLDTVIRHNGISQDSDGNTERTLTAAVWTLDSFEALGIFFHAGSRTCSPAFLRSSAMSASVSELHSWPSRRL